MLLARTKGLNKAQAITRHAFRNSMVPIANIIIPMFTHVMGGSLVIEQIFSIPGVGGIITKSVNARDHWLTMAALIFYASINLVTHLVVDISYGLIDPRIRLGGHQDD
jgi:oligopeptide transport system permease protein